MADASVPLRDVIDRVAASFERADLVFGHGTDNAWDEAVWLTLEITGYPDESGALQYPVSGAHQARITALAMRRCEERVPLAYLLGSVRYCGLTLAVSPDVIVPRSPIGHVLRGGLAPWLRSSPRTVLDLCCGTGALGLVAADAFPDCDLWLADIDPAALDVAARNVRELGVTHRTHIVESDVFDAVPDMVFDLILCNPPYVDSSDMRTLAREYRAEPSAALDGGKDGLDIIDRVLASLTGRLRSGGLFIGEVGASAANLLRRYPEWPFVWPDIPEPDVPAHAGALPVSAGVFLLEGAALVRDTARA